MTKKRLSVLKQGSRPARAHSSALRPTIDYVPNFTENNLLPRLSLTHSLGATALAGHFLAGQQDSAC